MILKKSFFMFIIPYICAIISGSNSKLSATSFSSLSFFYNPILRVSNGSEASPHQFPYHLILLTEQKYSCGAVLFHKYWAMTVEYCVSNDNIRKVIAGYVNINNPLATPGAVEVEIEKYFRYGRDGDHNFALIKLKQPIYQSKTIKYAHLPKKSLDLINLTGYVMGHGSSVQNGNYSDTLKYAVGKVTGKCGNYLCVKGVVPYSNVCTGDAGSPMVLNHKNKKCFTIIGVSHAQSKACADPELQAYFSNVTIYLDWIKEKMESN